MAYMQSAVYMPTYMNTSEHNMALEGTSMMASMQSAVYMPTYMNTSEHNMALEGTSMMASMQSAVYMPTYMNTSEPTSGDTALGFIISLCMVEQCLRYHNNDNENNDNSNISAVYIYKKYDITQIPANAFTGATYLEVSWNNTKKIYNAVSL